MSPTFYATIIALVLAAYIGSRVSNLPKNVWLLFVAQPLALTSASMMVLAGGLLGSQLAPSTEYATIPLTLMILSTAAGVIPASLLMKRFGRRKGTVLGLSSAILGAFLAALSAYSANFWLLIIGGSFLGFSMAFVAQMRFAMIESLADPKDIPIGISILMIGSMFAAVLGPEVAVLAKDWINSPHGYVGSFLALAIMNFLAILIVTRLAPIGVADQLEEKASRPLIQIVKQPLFIIAVCAGAVAYGVMSYIMTASPLSMHHIDQHDLQSTKWVIQSHIIAMYLPSLFSAFLIRYLGLTKVMLAGSFIYLAVIFVALEGQAVMHYWWAMVLLGIGWNFLYTSGTVLLPETYQTNERFKVQASNDFLIFFIQALASLAAGWILFGWNWRFLIQLTFPAVLLMILVSFWFIWINRKKVSSS